MIWNVSNLNDRRSAWHHALTVGLHRTLLPYRRTEGTTELFVSEGCPLICRLLPINRFVGIRQRPDFFSNLNERGFSTGRFFLQRRRDNQRILLFAPRIDSPEQRTDVFESATLKQESDARSRCLVWTGAINDNFPVPWQLMIASFYFIQAGMNCSRNDPRVLLQRRAGTKVQNGEGFAGLLLFMQIRDSDPRHTQLTQNPLSLPKLYTYVPAEQQGQQTESLSPNAGQGICDLLNLVCE